MTMPSWTVDEMLAEKPCDKYDRERIAKLCAGKPSLTLLEILDHPDIPDEDKVWVACRDKNPTRHVAIEVIVTRCVTNHALHCGIPAVEAWAQKWLSGEDRSSRAAARASRVAAWASRAAAEAARAAARAAWNAAWNAWVAWNELDEERSQQVQDFRDAAWAKQNERLTEMVMAEHEKEGMT
jgi:hypothetical protein